MMNIFFNMLKEAFSNYYFSIFIYFLLFAYIVLFIGRIIFDNKTTEDNKEKVNLEKTKEDKLNLFKDSFLTKVN